jgi:prepilin-type N-terminal cleavage/methylation domain-containing protein
MEYGLSLILIVNQHHEHKMNKKRKFKSAFSLVELSVVILIVSILMTGILTVSKSKIRNTNIQITQDKMAEIYKAIVRFVATHRRLPCPADITKASTASGFGSEVGTAGTCGGTGTRTASSNNIAPNNQTAQLAYGMVPVNALGLSNDMAQDGFGSKFYYVVDALSTAATANVSDYNGFEATPSTPQGSYTYTMGSAARIYVYDNSSTLSTPSALFVLISNGPNKSGSYNFNAPSANTAPNGASDEYRNIYGSDGYTFINSSTNTSYPFDDILLYKTKLQIVYDAGMQFIICSGQQNAGNAGESNWNTTYWNNAFYGNSPTAIVNCSSPRYCGLYGIWANPYPNC